MNLDEYIAKDGIDLGMYNGVADQLKMDGSYTLPFRKDWYMAVLPTRIYLTRQVWNTHPLT